MAQDVHGLHVDVHVKRVDLKVVLLFPYPLIHVLISQFLALGKEPHELYDKG